ncbi:MAG: hypothetical protein WD269_01410 [Acidimicrobiia bacterium]
MPSDKNVPKSKDVAALLTKTLGLFIAGKPAVIAVPTAAQGWLDDLLSHSDSYRDGAFVLLGYSVSAGEALNITTRPPGARTVAQLLGVLYPTLGIAGPKDAFQNIGKNIEQLVRGNRAAWDNLLSWASTEATMDEIASAFDYMAKGIASSARQIPPLPEIDVTTLTFSRVTNVLGSMLDTPSAGTHEQFIMAALLHAFVLQQTGGKQRVETKGINVADFSARVAGDIQIMEGGSVLEAFEVTANRWDSKVPQALEAMRWEDLPRVHIVGNASDLDEADLTELIPSETDVSVLDVRHEMRSLVSRLNRPSRREAINRLYQLLVEKQPDENRVEAFIARLGDAGLTVTAGP